MARAEREAASGRALGRKARGGSIDDRGAAVTFRLALAGACLLVVAACASAGGNDPGARGVEADSAAVALPTLRVEEIAGAEPLVDPAPADAVAEAGDRHAARFDVARVGEGGPGSAARVSVTATDADVRALLLALAEAAGLNLIVDAEVGGRRVSVRFDDIPALEALGAVMREAGLAVTGARPRPPWGPAVFYDDVVHIDGMDAAALQERFGVSAELAEWLLSVRAGVS